MSYNIYCQKCLDEHIEGISMTGVHHPCEKHGGSEINEDLYRKFFPELFDDEV